MKTLKTHLMQAVVFWMACIAYAATSHAASNEESEQLVRDRCAGCHSIALPDAATLTLQEKVARKGPPLHYAGQKYQQSWLTGWLQNPTRITPTGGQYWANAVVVTVEGDEIDSAKLQDHVALEAKEAEGVSHFLMTLKPLPELTPGINYTPGRVTMMLAEKDFRKFKGCAGCHRDEPDYGGVTGPELYSAMNRLQPEYVASYIAQPTAWDPHSLMPAKEINQKSIFKLMNYLNQIKEQAQ